MLKNLVINAVNKNLEICKKLNRSQKFYYFGVVLALFTCVLNLTPFSRIINQFTNLTFIIISFGVISDILSIYDKVWKTYLGKGLILVLYACATNIAYALSSVFVNEIVQYESSKLTYTINFVAALLIPLFIFSCTIVLFTVFYFFIQFQILIITHYESLKKNQCFDNLVPEKIECYPYISFTVRLIIIPVMFGICIAVSEKNYSAYIKFMEKNTKQFIYLFEAKRFSRCVKASKQRVIQLSDKEIILVSKKNNDYIFEAQTCVPKLKSAPTLKQEKK